MIRDVIENVVLYAVLLAFVAYGVRGL